MQVLNFIFGLGIAFSIFGFLWWIIMQLVNILRGGYSKRNQTMDYIFRIVKYFLLISVTANYIVKYQEDGADSGVGLANMILGVLVLGFYLMGKLQNRTMISQLSKHPLLARFSSSVDPKVERYLLSGSLVYFIFCLQYPAMVDNGVVNWFTDSIIGIYETPVIGWIFSVIAFFFLLSVIFRGANVIGRLISGQPLSSPGPTMTGSFNSSNPFEQFREKQRQDEEFVDYEDVTDEEDENEKK